MPTGVNECKWRALHAFSCRCSAGGVDFTCFRRHTRGLLLRGRCHIVLWRQQNRRFRHFTAQLAMLSRSCTLSDESKPTLPMQRLQPHRLHGCSGVTAVAVSPSSSWSAALTRSLPLRIETSFSSIKARRISSVKMAGSLVATPQSHSYILHDDMISEQSDWC